jgi:hypothetical protein
VPVDLHHVGEGPSVEIVADLTQEIAIGIEFEQLRRSSGICWAGTLTPGKYEHVAVGIDRDAAHFTETEIVRQLERIGAESKSMTGGCCAYAGVHRIKINPTSNVRTIASLERLGFNL